MPGLPVLRLVNVVKTYPGVTALGGVTLEVVEGEVHALLGENGAGKSTLMAVAAGATAPDSGTIEIGGEALGEADPARAQALGLSVVYQHTSVLDDLTVAENLLYCVPAERRASAASSSEWIDRQLAEVGADFDKRLRVSDLSIAERQLVEIARALALQPKVLVLDEPTEALTAVETERLFDQIARIKAQGTAVVYISHRLPEVRRVADRITILRDGRMRGTFPATGISEEEILALIIGRSVGRAFPDKTTQRDAGAPILDAKALRGGKLQGVDLQLRPGEVVGLAGVEGNGQRDFIRALAGLVSVSGELSVDGKAVRLSNPVAAQDGGIIYLPGDRHTEGAFLPLTVRENATALVLDRLAGFGFVSRNAETSLVGSFIRSLAVKTPSPEVAISTLSGGNQQKVLFARSMAAEPSVFLADEPTRGVDAGARVELYRVIREIAAKGAGVVVLSSDAIELQGLCDRVLVFSRGKVVRELTGDDLTEEKITGAAIGAAGHREADVHKSGHEGLKRFFSGDLAPTLILLALIVVLGLYTTTVNERFLSVRSLNGTLFLASALAFIAMGQLIVLLTGGIDLSVGPLTGLTVVILSFFATELNSPPEFLLGLVVAIGAAALVGLVNGVLIRIVGLSPLITTLAMFIALQGVSLVLRSVPDGFFRREIVQTLTMRIGPLPLAFLAAVATALLLEWALRKTRYGMELRAIGSSEVAAHRAGARVNRSVILAYVSCSVLTAIGGFMLAAQVGVGDPTVGQNYTLQSISAVVLGGASIFGGRGSFLGALAGVILVQEITATSGFLGLGTAWQYWLPGLLILAATAMYSRTRARTAAAH
ncbi:MAG: ATP-binding cassette domain-containing protein [Rhizobiaceae bacterium]|nr:ATP-binding cassette domain-containing protein [Rhizobiaceae bacterium]